MSSLSLFIVGTLVTLIVSAAMALLVWGAIMDGRDETKWREERERAARPREEAAVLSADRA